MFTAYDKARENFMKRKFYIWCVGKEFLPLQGQYTFSKNLKQVSNS
jgi:hypothetical protein